MKNKLRKILLLSLAFAVCITVIGGVSAATWDIANGETSGNIQGVINVASDGDTLSFYNNGVYNLTHLNITKSLILEGNAATLNGDGVSGSAVPITLPVLNITANDVTINNFTINAAIRPLRDVNAISAENVENLKITNNKIIDITSATAISLRSVHIALLQNNEINGVSTGRDAIGLVNSSDITIQYNNISGFTRNGISLAAGNFAPGTSTFNISIQYNNIDYIDEEGIFFGGGVFDVKILNNNFTNIRTDASVSNAINIARSTIDILIQGNMIVGWYTGIRVEENNNVHNGTNTTLSNVIIDNNALIGNHYGILLVNLNDPDTWIDILWNSLNVFLFNDEPIGVYP